MGCSSYEENPLQVDEIITQVEKARQVDFLRPGENFTFTKAAQWMSEKSPVLEELKDHYAEMKSVADVKTPWPNPSIEFGQRRGSKLAPPGVGHKNQPFVGLGFTIPISGRLGREDDLNQVKAQQAFYELNLSHRDLYLQLRRKYVGLYLAHRSQKVHQEVSDAASTIARLGKTLQDAGATTALDVGMMELEAGQAELALLRVKEETILLEAGLSSLLGVDSHDFSKITESTLPLVPKNIPGYQELKGVLILNQPELIRLRASYEVAEKQLRLEVSKQYPDIRFGVSQSEEVGEKTEILGLSIGIDIPLFDTNQQGIARAENHREEIRHQYVSQLHVSLSELQRALKSVKLSENRQKLLKEVLVPQSENNLKMAEQSLRAGGIDALKYLDVKRRQQKVMKEMMVAESDLWRSWIDLEKAVGHPLLRFPGEEASHYPNLPENQEK